MRLIVVMLLFVAQGGMMPGPGTPHTTASCSVPSFTNVWPIYGAGVTCNGGSACSVGLGIDTVPSLGTGGANSLTQTTGGNRPLYLPAAINSQPSATFTSGDSFNITTPISGTLIISVYAVFAPSIGAGTSPITGNRGSNGAFEWRINGAGGTQQMNIAGVDMIGSGTATFPATTYSAALAQYNMSTNAWALFTISGGSASADGSGTYSGGMSLTQGINSIGFSDPDGAFQGNIAEVGTFAGTSTTGVAAYVNCKYGI